jgi:hypothetical protein
VSSVAHIASGSSGGDGGVAGARCAHATSRTAASGFGRTRQLYPSSSKTARDKLPSVRLLPRVCDR